MTRLRCAPPRLASAPSRLGSGATAGTGFARTDGLSAAARGYDAAWRHLRLARLRANPLCVRCEQTGRRTPATQALAEERFSDAIRTRAPARGRALPNSF